MGRTVIITLLALMGAGTVAAQGGLSERPHAAYDSLAVEFPDLHDLSLPSNGMFPPAQSFPRMEPRVLSPLAVPGSVRFGMSEFPASSPLPFAPRRFVMPDTDLFFSLDRFRRQQGITIPAGSVNSPRMILSNVGYMPLVVRGDHTLGLTGSRQRFPSMGFSNSLSAGYVWEATDGITLYGNLDVSDNMYHLNRFKDIGVSGRARVRVTDGIWLNGYGTYSLYNNAGTQPMPRGLYPTNSFGGTIEVKITDRFGVEGGAFREYDPFQRRWVTQPYVMPVFY